MPEPVRIKNIIPTMKMLKGVNEFLSSKRGVEEITEAVYERILRLTKSGKDYKSRKFRSYTKEYAKRKGQNTVDLEASGDMIDAIFTKIISSRHGQVSVKASRHSRGRTPTDQIAHLHNEGTARGGKIRRFMDVPQSVLTTLIRQHINDPIKKILGRA